MGFLHGHVREFLLELPCHLFYVLVIDSRSSSLDDDLLSMTTIYKYMKHYHHHYMMMMMHIALLLHIFCRLVSFKRALWDMIWTSFIFRYHFSVKRLFIQRITLQNAFYFWESIVLLLYFLGRTFMMWLITFANGNSSYTAR